jgi:hypothetical protein
MTTQQLTKWLKKEKKDVESEEWKNRKKEIIDLGIDEKESIADIETNFPSENIFWAAGFCFAMRRVLNKIEDEGI